MFATSAHVAAPYTGGSVHAPTYTSLPALQEPQLPMFFVYGLFMANVTWHLVCPR